MELAGGVLHLRRGRSHLGLLVVPDLPKFPRAASACERDGARTYPRARRDGQRQSSANRKAERAVGDAAAIAEYVGDHGCLFHLSVLPLDLLRLAAVLLVGLLAFHRPKGG